MTLSRLNTFSRCLRTVCTETNSRLAMSVLLCPAATRRSSSHCRGGQLGYGITGAFPLLEQLVEVRAKQSQQQIPPGGGGQAHHGFVFKTEGVKIALLHTGGVPLPGRHVVRDPQDRQQAMEVLRDLFTDQA